MNKPHHESLGSLFESLLKSPPKLINSFSQTDKPAAIIAKLLLLSLGGFLIFGITLGSFSFHEQLWAAPLKTLLGISFSAIICLPSLYVFSALTGTPLGMKEIVQGMAGSLALMASLLLGFTPVLWVFSQSTTSESFFGFLVLTTWLIALFFGTRFLLKMLAQSGTTQSGPLRIWIGIFLLVTLQMATTLRPLIGRSDTFFTSEKLFFLEHWGMTVSDKRSTDYPDSKPQPVTPENPQPSPTKNSQTNPFLDD